MANPAGTLKQAKTAGNELTDSEFKTACSLLPHVLKLIRALYSGMEAQSVHTLVSQHRSSLNAINASSSLGSRAKWSGSEMPCCDR